MNASKTLRVLLAATLLSGCAGAKIKYVKPDFKGPDFVAVLPPDNHSTDLMAPRAVMSAVSSALIGLGYFPVLSPVQEEVLREMGMTDGGQVRAFKLSDISAKLGTDGIAVTTINQFGTINLGFYISPTVDCTVALHDAGGEKLWEADSVFSQKRMALSSTNAIAAAAGGLVGDVLGRMFKTHMIKESQQMAGLMVQQCLTNKPTLAYPGPGYLDTVESNDGTLGTNKP